MAMTREEINARRELAKLQFAAEAVNKKGQGVMFMPDNNDSQEEINMEDNNVNAEMVARIAEIVIKELQGTQASASFKSGTYTMVISDIKVVDHTNKAGVTNPWVRMTLNTESFKRPIFADITIAGDSKKIINKLSVELKGKALTSRSNYSKFMESLKGMTITGAVNEKILPEGKTVLKSALVSWKAV